jgi:hypothetical protein
LDLFAEARVNIGYRIDTGCNYWLSAAAAASSPVNPVIFASLPLLSSFSADIKCAGRIWQLFTYSLI